MQSSPGSTSQPEFLYATGNNQILSFTVDPSTGALSNAATIPGPNTVGITTTMAADPKAKFLFVEDTQGEAIDVYSVRPTDGALTVAGSPFAIGNFAFPGGLATDATGNFLYVEGLAGILALSVNSPGALAKVMGSPFGAPVGGAEVVADPAGGFIYIGSTGDPETISGFAINSAQGALTPVPGSPFSAPSGPPNLIVGNVISVAVHPSGKFLYAGLNNTGSSIGGWAIDSATGALSNVVARSPFQTNSAPGQVITSIVIDPTGKFLYAYGPSGGIFGFLIDANSGTLTAMNGSPFRIPFAISGNLLIDPSGQFLYGPAFFEIVGMGIDASSGALTPLAGSPFPTPSPLTLPATLTIAKVS